MIRMIPPIVHPGAPGSERRVFDAIRTGKGTERWTVLHSLGIANSWGAGYGEIDFVIMIPDLGIVCVEVKGGGVRVANGIWTTRNASGETEELKRSPFAQVQDNMWKLWRILRSRFGAESAEATCPIGWMVVLPDVDCPSPTTEFTRPDVVDRHDMEKDICRCIRDAPSLRALSARNDLTPPSAQTIQSLARFLRPSFERVAIPNIIGMERTIISLTEEQYEVLDGIQDNALCLVKGTAGTGKTLLALEGARRCAANGDGALVACFNRALGKWLTVEASSCAPGVVMAGTLHSQLRERILRSSFHKELESHERENASDLFERVYFELGALAIEELNEPLSLLLIDEVQDFPSQGLVDVVKAWMATSPNGRVILFGDFTRQALYGTRADLALLRSGLDRLTVFSLSTNCRNTKRIAIQTDLMTGYTGTRSKPGQIDGDPVEIEYVASDSAVSGLVARIFVRLREAGYKAHDVVVLSGRQRANSSLAGVDRLSGWVIRDVDASDGDVVAFATIQAFKGLERRAVIVIDTYAPADETDALLYVAMSRARLRLFVICDDRSRAAINQRIADGAARMVKAT